MSAPSNDTPGIEIETGTEGDARAQTNEENGKKRRVGSGQLNEVYKDKPMTGTEDTTQEQGGEEDGQLPPLLIAQSISNNLFDGVPCTTIAKSVKRGREQYINRYGIPSAGWLVISDTCATLEAGMTVKDLFNVSDTYDRIIDHHRPAKATRIKASDVAGIRELVWEVDLSIAGNPLAAAEVLNPRLVKSKKSKKSKNSKKTKTRSNAYPTTYVYTEFKDSIIKTLDVQGWEKKKLAKDAKCSFELGSKYRGLYKGSDGAAALYKAARAQAERFLDWYRETKPEAFDAEGQLIVRADGEEEEEDEDDDEDEDEEDEEEEEEEEYINERDKTREVKKKKDALKKDENNKGANSKDAKKEEVKEKETDKEEAKQDETQKQDVKEEDEQEFTEADKRKAYREGWMERHQHKALTPALEKRFDAYYAALTG